MLTPYHIPRYSISKKIPAMTYASISRKTVIGCVLSAVIHLESQLKYYQQWFITF
jgi:hypothetical protein